MTKFKFKPGNILKLKGNNGSGIRYKLIKIKRRKNNKHLYQFHSSQQDETLPKYKFSILVSVVETQYELSLKSILKKL